MRPLAVGAPVALVGAGLAVVDDDAPVAVAVGDEELARSGVDLDVGGAVQVRGVVAALRLAGAADLQDEAAVERELQDLVVLRPVAGEPDEVLGVDVDAVLGLRPLVAGAGAAPVAQRGCPHGRRPAPAGRRRSTGRRRVAGGEHLALLERGGAVDDPDVVAAVHGDARDLAEDPVVRQRLRPEGVDLEGRGRVRAVVVRRLLRAERRGGQRHHAEHGGGEATGKGSARGHGAFLSLRGARSGPGDDRL